MASFAQDNPQVLITTSYGNMKIRLFDETPLHKENFFKLVADGTYNGVLFHRVIENFMIQTGDPDSKNAKKGELLGRGDFGYTLPPEFSPSLYHKKGAIAAARQPDNVNPQKMSSASQFYIVQGTKLTDEQLDLMESREMHIKFTDEQRKIYKSSGGTPHLDYSYTVFGEVVEGLDIIDKISAVPTDENNRPLHDIKIEVKIID